MSQRRFHVVGVLIAAAILVPGLVHAGAAQIGGQDGTGDPPGELCDDNSDDGCTVQVDWNPSRSCVADPPPGGVGEAGIYTDVNSLLDCMLNEQERVAGNFASWKLDDGTFGIGIHRVLPFTVPPDVPELEPVEIERLEIFENDPGIKTTQLSVDRSGLVARIQKIVEGPDPIGNGSVTIELDDDIVESEEKEDPPLPPDSIKWTRTWDTAGLTGLDLNIAILVWLRFECGLLVQQDAGFFVVSRDEGFRRVQFRAAVNGVISSDLALLPKTDPDVVHLFDIGL